MSLQTEPTGSHADLPAAGSRLPRTATEALAALDARPRETFLANRYPHTYAYDFLRANAELFGVPKDVAGSRAQIAAYLEQVTGGHSDRMQVIYAAAQAYLEHHRIDAPISYRDMQANPETQVLRRVYRAIDAWSTPFNRPDRCGVQAALAVITDEMIAIGTGQRAR